ncbi:MAG: hypothetical protein DMG27_23990 [Acidobacteria bacterium]|nr:MAG: hypothetical protein DMG27_23990 [Acidobacteriota bacterium]
MFREKNPWPGFPGVAVSSIVHQVARGKGKCVKVAEQRPRGRPKDFSRPAPQKSEAGNIDRIPRGAPEQGLHQLRDSPFGLAQQHEIEPAPEVFLDVV